MNIATTPLRSQSRSRRIIDDANVTRSMKLPFVAFLFAFAAPLLAAEQGKLSIELQPLGDTAQGVVTRTTFRYVVGSEVPPGVPLVIVGSVSQGGAVVKHFRYTVDL